MLDPRKTSRERSTQGPLEKSSVLSRGARRRAHLNRSETLVETSLDLFELHLHPLPTVSKHTVLDRRNKARKADRNLPKSSHVWSKSPKCARSLDEFGRVDRGRTRPTWSEFSHILSEFDCHRRKLPRNPPDGQFWLRGKGPSWRRIRPPPSKFRPWPGNLQIRSDIDRCWGPNCLTKSPRNLARHQSNLGQPGAAIIILERCLSNATEAVANA